MNVMQTQSLPRTKPADPSIPDEIQEAIRILLRWAGDDPRREGLIDTPMRIGRAWREQLSGYREDPLLHLRTTFANMGDYDDIVVLRAIPFRSHCEHHLAPIIGTASIAYLPNGRVVGISKLARVLHTYASRLQSQGRLTAQVADCLWSGLAPSGVAVALEAAHGCMASRGGGTHGVNVVTSKMIGCFEDDAARRKEVLSLMGIGSFN